MNKQLRDALSFAVAGLFLLAFGLWAKQLPSGAFGAVLLAVGLYNLYNYWHDHHTD
ncbi:hypothetical protein ACRYI5_06585 [Furfurilactobacillus sp. WILCCON 0119]|uniref:hypothetical protein n=1 Tax=Furfurilactobacillus entadae TaxID=2922307 RepID=UPI0035E80923